MDFDSEKYIERKKVIAALKEEPMPGDDVPEELVQYTTVFGKAGMVNLANATTRATVKSIARRLGISPEELQ